MEELISKMLQFADLQGAMKAWCVQNSIETPKILVYTVEKISKLYENFLDKYGSQQNFFVQGQNSAQPIWFENELTLFQWTVIAFSLSNQIYLSDFKKIQLEQLSKIFRNKETYIIDYQIKCMQVKGKQIRNAWKAEEQKILSTIIQETVDKNKWNQIARQLYKNSEGKYFRQGKHCRQRWFSYIENRKAEKQWNAETDIELLELISAIGKRWSQIANKITKSQTRLTLRKRFKALLESAYSKLGHNISEREAVSFLLQEKYETASYDQNKNFSKKSKRTYETVQNQNSVCGSEKNSYEKEISSLENKQLNDSKDMKQKYENQDDQKMNIIMGLPMVLSENQEAIKNSIFHYQNKVQMNENICNIGYIPIPYYPQMYPIITPMNIQMLSYGINSNNYPLCNQLMFYL